MSFRRLALFAIVAAALAGCQAAPPPPPPPPPIVHAPPPFTQTGLASWYGANFEGKRTADGGHFREDGLTAAHRTLPLGTVARVTNLENGRSVTVRITDRGPYEGKRIIDVSARAAAELGMKKHGVVRVRIEVVDSKSAAS